MGELTGHSFPRMRIVYKNGNTVLVGPVRDQAELTGLLQRFSDFGLNILSVTTVEEPPTRWAPDGGSKCS